MTPRRPVLRYHGSKWRIAPWIISHMPPHDVYVEAYGGGASVLLRKPRVGAEVYNDLDGRVVNVFRVLQDRTKAEELRRRLAYTLYARAEFDRCYEPATDDIDEACKTIALSQMGHGTDSLGRTCRTGFRSKLNSHALTPASSWETWPREVERYVDRFQGVVVEQRDAVEVMRRMDTEHTLHYVDPPYISSTRTSLSHGRGSSHGYRHEMTDEQHRQLSAALHAMQGLVLLSGYPSSLYQELYPGWQRYTREVYADAGSPRTEVLWLNDAAAERYLRQGTLPMQEVA